MEANVFCHIKKKIIRWESVEIKVVLIMNEFVPLSPASTGKLKCILSGRERKKV